MADPEEVEKTISDESVVGKYAAAAEIANRKFELPLKFTENDASTVLRLRARCFRRQNISITYIYKRLHHFWVVAIISAADFMSCPECTAMASRHIAATYFGAVRNNISVKSVTALCYCRCSQNSYWQMCRWSILSRNVQIWRWTHHFRVLESFQKREGFKTRW